MITEQQHGWGWQRHQGLSGLAFAPAGSPRAEGPGSHPGNFWRSPRRFPVGFLWTTWTCMVQKCSWCSGGHAMLQLCSLSLVLALGTAESSLAPSSFLIHAHLQNSVRMDENLLLSLLFSWTKSPSSLWFLTSNVLLMSRADWQLKLPFC